HNPSSSCNYPASFFIKSLHHTQEDAFKHFQDSSAVLSKVLRVDSTSHSSDQLEVSYHVGNKSSKISTAGNRTNSTN
ncbi:hypothetical protein Tco_0224602, partial [Tanacetum coccineum]